MVECYAIQEFPIVSYFDLPYAERTESDYDEKSWHYHTIRSFVSFRLPFLLQIGSREIPHVSHLDTEGKHCPRPYQHRAVQASLDRYKPFTLRRVSKTDGLAHMQTLSS